MSEMRKYMVERDTGPITPEEARIGGKRSNEVLEGLGADIQWLETFVTPEKVYCVYIARNEEIVRKHSELGPFTLSAIYPITDVIDPTSPPD